MFQIDLLMVGKNKEKWVEAAIAHYLLLLKKYSTLKITYIPDIKNAGNLTAKELRKAEADAISKHIRSGYQIALADKGKAYDSIQFGAFLQQLMQKTGRVEFIIGGIFGLDDSILQKSKQILSLSPMTFSHQLARPILLEQLYRGFSIMAGTGYHK